MRIINKKEPFVRFYFDEKNRVIIGELSSGDLHSKDFAVVRGKFIFGLIHVNHQDFPGILSFEWHVPNLLCRIKEYCEVAIIDLYTGLIVYKTQLPHDEWQGQITHYITKEGIPDITKEGIPEPQHWRNGLAGPLAVYLNEIADGLYVDVDPLAIDPYFRREGASISELQTWGLRLEAKSENPWSIHYQLDETRTSIGRPLFTKLLHKTIKDSSFEHTTIEAYLTIWTGFEFKRLRRIARTQTLRSLSTANYEIALDITESSAAQSGILFFTWVVSASYGIVMKFSNKKAYSEDDGKFEDIRLRSTFDHFTRIAKMGMSKKYSSLIGDKSEELFITPPVSSQTVSTDIIIPIFNELLSVERCVYSILKGTFLSYRIILLDDGGNDFTAIGLRKLASLSNNIEYHRRDRNRGYTRTVNEGIKLARSEWVVILNSDTVVSDGWLARLHGAATATGASLIGPLSNAASWQSIPQVKRSDGTWSNNDVITYDHVEQVQMRLISITKREYPCFPILNGFCMLISMAVFDEIGLLDEEAFPLGYGEETDLCLRAAAAGFKMVVADDCFIYHEKSISFGAARRSTLSREGNVELRAKYPGLNIKYLEKSMQNNATLNRIRDELGDLKPAVKTTCHK